jgi:hypothetical protein
MHLILAATIAGAGDFVEIEACGNERLDLLRTFLPCERGISSHDALNDLANALDPELFTACFTSLLHPARPLASPIIDPDGARLLHHQRGAGRANETEIATGSRLQLDPPGIDVDLAEVLAN